MTEESTRCGFVAIVGRPNVGKSTLMNHILGQKISITSRKPQTTRHQILGIKTQGQDQMIYVDTPGLHDDASGKALNRFMNKAAAEALRFVDLIIFMVDRTRWMPEDELVLNKLMHVKAPVVLVVNKVDQLKDKSELLPHIDMIKAKREFVAILPLSAKQGHNVEALEELVRQYLPQGPHHFPEDQITDRSSRFVVAEIVREKLMRNLGDEVPYGVTVEIEEFAHDGTLLTISALILVEREGQKRIVIGDKGAVLKAIGRDARLDIERMFECKVMLNLWVKVRRGWSDDERALRSLGYGQE
ncbi:GTPase Era [Nitrincola tapanii]|uniref:GTPase Era n=1 Tax=Nitrincola tapanii TaxID=1708751 RepID=A0A5A9VZB9_9GAMM|nr:GTPase Era [Nitrincola tapanii]KAA0873826.1 GTPase Era [Nitrincola tapanii]